jgi:branched-chain amino acid transport system ATP-binding protein
MLELRDVSVRFGAVVAVDGVSLEVAPQEVLGVIGPNGSGKTTLLNAVTGIVPADGQLLVDGNAVPMGKPLKSRGAGILRMFQAPQTFTNLTCIENVLLASDDTAVSGLTAAWITRIPMRRHEKARWEAAYAALERVGLPDVADSPSRLLTYGEQRLLELARALAGQPRLLLLDEPSAGLNDVETAKLTTLIRSLQAQQELTFVVIDHKIDFIDSICDRVCVLELGRVIATGRPADIWSDPHVMTAYLGDVDNG